MTDRAKVTESVQIGLESTEGTAVAAPNNIRSVSVDTKIGGAAEFFRPDGRKFNTLSTLNQEWSTFALNGKGTFTEICWPLAMMFGNPSPASSGVGVKTRVYDMPDTTILTPKAGTIMKGNSVRAQKMAGAILADLTMAFSRKTGITLTGGGIGRLFTDGITMTASPTDIPLVPLVGKQLDIFIDPTAAALGSTKLLRAFSLENALTGVFGPIWAIDSSQTSYSGHIDLAPTTGTKIMLEADATGMAYLSQYRADTLMFIRIQATGPSITGETSTISGNTVANPTVVTTSAPHGLVTGETVTISGSNSTPTIDGTRVVTVISSTTFSVPVNVTVLGTAGTVTIPYLFQYDTCVNIKTFSPDEDDDGVTTVTFDTELIKDSTWGKALEITVVNDVASVA